MPTFCFGLQQKQVEEIQIITEKIYKTVFGKYILPSRTYLSCTRPSLYVQEQKAHGFVTGTNPKNNVIVYPLQKQENGIYFQKKKRTRNYG